MAADETPELGSQLQPPTPAERALLNRIESRRLALQNDQQQLRSRYEEVMRWANPPWDAISRRQDPRPEMATARRSGINALHVDLVGPALTRWAALQMGAAPIFRCRPKHVALPLPSNDPAEAERMRKQYELDRAIAQNQSSQIEDQTAEWMERVNLHRTLLWAAWSKEAFGKAVLRCGWDPVENLPTAELMENPSQVYYGWTRRYGQRKLGWAMVVDQMSPQEANFRFGLNIPTDTFGAVDVSNWTGVMETGEMDQRVEQTDELNRWVYAEEYWELVRERGEPDHVLYCLAVAGRIVDGPYEYEFLPRLPFHVLENEHISTWSHGKSLAEVIIPINEAYDDMLDRQQLVIQFESGPRYKGLNMANSGDEVDIPDPFNLVPLREGEDIQQLDTRVDFFPSQLHANELREAKYKATGLTPIAWGMSPNAQTSGRAMSAEWRAVELPLHSRLITIGPDIRDLISSWWDYAEAYSADHAKVAAGYRRFSILWVPLDIRDKTEKTLDIIQRLQANLIDPETAIEECGYENGPEIIAKIRAYLLDPVWNPLRYQQLLTLQQLELNIRQQMLQTQMLEQQAAQQGAAPQPGAQTGPTGEELSRQGVNAAGEQAQGPGGMMSPAQNQGPLPGGGGGGMPLQTSILSQTPLQGGVGSRVLVPLQGPTPTAGNQPR